MTEEQYAAYNRAVLEGIIKDEDNPIFILSLTNSKLLVKIANGELDMKALALLQLKCRGLNEDGVFVGFSR